MCDQLNQISDFALRQNPSVLPTEVVQITCGSCGRKEVCPELGVDAYLRLAGATRNVSKSDPPASST